MSNSAKSISGILKKLNINKLNPMQEEAFDTISYTNDVVLLSPTGSGKTVAFLLPIIKQIDPACSEVQIMILVPARELAIQIEQVIRSMGTGHKVNALYGGRSSSKDKMEIKHTPAIIVGTPGRIASHLNRESFSTKNIKTLVLDEFDKSLEIGFESEMKEIINQLRNVEKRILTSATFGVDIPEFVGLNETQTIDYLQKETTSQLEVKTVHSPTKDKLEALVGLLCHIGNQPGIIFCNYKDTIQRVSDYLSDNKITHACFYGGMEQIDREKSLIQFRNGSTQILIATDLAARGIDVPEIKFIIHYQLPFKAEEFTHRNGRTARMNSEGTAYVLQWKKETAPDFITDAPVISLNPNPLPQHPKWTTVFISGGRRDKISKGDIVGLFCKQGKLTGDQINSIELQQTCSYVGVPSAKANSLIALVNNSKLKNKKVRVSLL